MIETAPAYTIELPLPPRALHPNDRPHPRAKNAAVKKYRDLVEATARIEAMKGDDSQHGMRFVWVWFDYYFKTAARRDDDGLYIWPKAAIDGLKLAGVFKDDDRIKYVPPRQSKDAERPRLVVEVYRRFPLHLIEEHEQPNPT